MLSRIPLAPSMLASSSGLEMAARRPRRRGVAGGVADAHEGRAGGLHDRAHVREVEIDQAGHGDEVGDPLYALAQDVVRHAEGVEDGGRLLGYFQQAVIGDDDQCVHLLLEPLDAFLRLQGAFRPSIEKGRVTTPMVRAPISLAISATMGERAGAGAAALAGGDEDHVGALEGLGDGVPVPRAASPTSGSAPTPRPRVTLPPM